MDAEGRPALHGVTALMALVTSALVSTGPRQVADGRVVLAHGRATAWLGADATRLS
jgi:hypothetical protein